MNRCYTPLQVNRIPLWMNIDLNFQKCYRLYSTILKDKHYLLRNDFFLNLSKVHSRWQMENSELRIKLRIMYRELTWSVIAEPFQFFHPQPQVHVVCGMRSHYMTYGFWSVTIEAITLCCYFGPPSWEMASFSFNKVCHRKQSTKWFNDLGKILQKIRCWACSLWLNRTLYMFSFISG